MSKSFKIVPKAISKTTVKLSAAKYTYSGKVKKPVVSVKELDGSTVAKSNYVATYSKGRKNVGTYTVKITGKGNYTGTFSKTFKIVPKRTSISKLSSRPKGFTAKWKKKTAQVTGYQIQYSTSSKFTSNEKTITVKKNSTLTKKISKLKDNKKYHVRIRTYKTVSGKKYYSVWSKEKTVKTKK